MNLQPGFSVPIHDLNFFTEKNAKEHQEGANIGSTVASAHITYPYLNTYTALMI
jgi:hypothetical protein